MTLRRPTLPQILALGSGLVLIVWLAFGDLQRFRAAAPEADPPPVERLPRVEVQESEQAPYRPSLVAQGQLMPWREIELRARATGQVESLALAAGQEIEAGDLLLGLDQGDLPSQLARAEAELELARAELAAADRLRERDLVSQTERLRLASAVAQAVADVESLRQALTHTRPRAPFPGRLDRLDVEEGDLLQVGEPYALLIEDRRLKAQAFVSQRDALNLEPGLEVGVTLMDGSRLDGELTHVASRADPGTRTFTVEARLDNPERRRLGGASATLDIALAEHQAHILSPALLLLDEAGRLGVKTLDDDDRVEFRHVSLLSADSQRARVAGLPERVRLITLGGGFVEVGERVEPVAVTLDTVPGEGDTTTLTDGGLPITPGDAEGR